MHRGRGEQEERQNLRQRFFEPVIYFIGSFFLVVAFQNCGDKVDFEGIEKTSLNPGSDIVCDPLNPNLRAGCSISSGEGLIGNLYYLTDQYVETHDTKAYRIETFLKDGIRAPVLLLFNGIDVSERSWTSGFYNSDGQYLVNDEGKKLVEWFSVDLIGNLTLPRGDYQFAIVSDDGMRVTLNDQVVLVDDSIHGPRWKCASDMVTFGTNERKIIRVNYWQGPRTQIAMQLFIRPASNKSQSCGSGGGFQIVPPSAFSHE